MASRTIKVPYLARVEGEVGLRIKIRNNAVKEARLNIFEPPRFFEAFLRGRDFSEAPDITARICGICPVAYQMSAVHALERAFGVTVGKELPAVRALRRLLYCGEWIESHVLHVFMLHAPDFLGYEDAIRMAADHPETVTTALAMKKTGNDVMILLAGREIHPVNVRVGGFYKVPSKKNLQTLVEKLERGRDAAVEAVAFTAKLPFPDFERDYEFVALRHPDEYPLNEGRLVSNKGLDIDISEFNDHFAEEHVEHSNSLHSVLRERGAYFVGPLARFNLNFDRLTPLAQECARKAGVTPPCRNPFQGIVVRAVETVYAFEEALRIIAEYEPPDRPAVEFEPRAGIGHGCSEAPRGFLYHRYRIGDDGSILEAQIVPPTAQNQKTIEEDLCDYANRFMDLDDDKLTWQCEQAVRNYDPCISCSAHFLKLEIDRG